jgi:hypothetical protein
MAGVADRGWVDEVLDYLRRAAHDDLLNVATADRLSLAGNIGGERLNWAALDGVALMPEERSALLEGRVGVSTATCCPDWHASSSSDSINSATWNASGSSRSVGVLWH